ATPPSARNVARLAATRRLAADPGSGSSPCVMRAFVCCPIMRAARPIAVGTIRDRVAMKSLLVALFAVMAGTGVIVVGRARTPAEQRTPDCERQYCFHRQIDPVGVMPSSTTFRACRLRGKQPNPRRGVRPAPTSALSAAVHAGHRRL